METFLIYLLKASSGIILLYAIYWVFLRKETFYQVNRWFLLGGLLMAALIPLFPFHYTVFVDAEQSSNALNGMRSISTNSNSFNDENLMEVSGISWQQVLFIVYLTGAFIFLFRLAFQSFILLFLIAKNKTKQFGGLRILENEKYGLPFSFFNIVFINPKFHKQEELSEILAHEKVHIHEYHWFDLLIIELLTVVFWFNPFIWLYERSIKQNHEFLADAGVLSRGYSIGRYQALLINQLMGMQIIGITNNLNFALNTNRLKMMTKQKTPKIKSLKLALAIPAIALLLVAFAKPSYRAASVDPADSELSIREIPGNKAFVIHGKVIDTNGDPMPGAAILIKGTAIGTVADMDGTFELKDPNPKEIDEGGYTNVSKLVISFVGYQTSITEVKSIGDGEKSKYTFELQRESIAIGDIDEILSSPPPPPPPPAPEKGKLEPSKLKKGEKEREVFYVVEEMPQYPGGVHALAEYVKKVSQKYAKAKKIDGKVLVGFTVGPKGDVRNIQILKKPNDMAAKAAYSIIDGLENWSPGKQRGKPVSVDYTIVVKFS